MEIEFDDAPPDELRVRAALWETERLIRQGAYFAATRALEAVRDVHGESDAVVRGLHHLAAAGYKAQTGEPERAARQLAHARRRLAPFLPEHEQVDLAALLAAVEAELAG